MQNQTFKFRRKEPTPYLTVNNLGNILIQRPIHKKEKGVGKVFEAPINLTLNNFKTVQAMASVSLIY